MARHPIPDAALAQHIAILGKTGSGKTYAAKGAVENILQKKGRVCVIDPTGAWHGLRSSANGKKAGFPVVIFGGEHADWPVSATHGEALAEIIGTSSTPAVIDVSSMRVSDRTRFFTDFADTLLRKNKGPLHLIIDEAHLFAPQGKVNDPQSGKMLHAANNLVSLGRSRGLRIAMITQRPAKLHKDSLTQVETLVALRLIAPQDRKAVEEWIKDNADEGKGREIMTSLARLPTGSGWVWAPEINMLKRVSFPKIKTFDTSKAPSGRAGKGPVLAPINRGAIEKRLKDVAADVVANDPRNMKAEIAALKKQLATKTPAGPSAADKAATAKSFKEGVKAAEAAAYSRGMADGYAEATKAASKNMAALFKALNSAKMLSSQIEHWAAKKPPPAVRKPKVPSMGTIVVEPFPKPPQNAYNGALVSAEKSAAMLAKIKKSAPLAAAVKPTGLTGPQQRIMASLAFWRDVGHPEPTREQVAAVAGYKPTSGGFKNLVGGLSSGGEIAIPASGRLSLAMEYPALSAAEARSKLRGVLSVPQQRIVDAAMAVDVANDISRENLAEAAGYLPTSGGFKNLIGTLSTMTILNRTGTGRIALADWAREVLG